MKKLLTLVVLMISVGTTQAAVTIQTSPLNPQQTTSLSGYQTSGDDMVGMTVTANGTDIQTWGALRRDDYGVRGLLSGSEWSLKFKDSDDTYNKKWKLETKASLTSLLIDAGTGNTMFDILNDDNYTDGSYKGYVFTVETLDKDYKGNIDVTYSGSVSLVGDSFQGDLYRYMLIEFSNAFTGKLEFRTDTDNAAFTNDITPTTVPVPGALLLASLGSCVAGCLRRRQWV